VGGTAQTLAPLRLSQNGYSASDLGALLLAGAAVAILATPIAGYLADRHGIRVVSTAWGVFVAFFMTVAAVADAALLVILLLIALVPLSRVGGALAYTLGADSASLGTGLAVGYGLILSAWSLGAAAGPPLAGALADAAGDAVAFACASLLAIMLVIPIATARPRFESQTTDARSALTAGRG
jgi:MFS family permease